MMHWAIQQLNKNGLQVLRCSSLYETAPAYVTDQPAFLNAAVLVRTALTPPSLLSMLKGLESKAGRDLGGLRWGPRPLDLDIIFYGAGTYKDSKLEIPHPRWSERSFVTVPVSDLWYDTDAQRAAHGASTGSPPTVPGSSSNNDSNASDSSRSSSSDSITQGNSGTNNSDSSSSSSSGGGSNSNTSKSSSDHSSSESCGSGRLPSDAPGSVHTWLSRAVQLVHGAASSTAQAYPSLLSHSGHSSSSPPHIFSTPPSQTRPPPMSAPPALPTHAAAEPPHSMPDHGTGALPGAPLTSACAPTSSSSSTAVAVEGAQIMQGASPLSSSTAATAAEGGHIVQGASPLSSSSVAFAVEGDQTMRSDSPSSTSRAAIAEERGQIVHSGSLPLNSRAAVAVEGGQIMQRVMPMGRGGRTLVWGTRTHIMGILNVTPDSFSDGGRFMETAKNNSSSSSSSSGSSSTGSSALSSNHVHGSSESRRRSSGHDHSGQGSGSHPVAVDLAVQAAICMVDQGADIIDIGGQSTRPGAVAVSAEEEAARVVPVIRALKACPQLGQTLTSIDTYRAEVTRQAVHAGADMVNDVSGGTLDAHMLSEVASLGVPYVLMHMRGDPTTMASSPHMHYACVWREVGLELQAAVDRAVQAGIPTWNILLDPGIGFAKSAQGSLELIRHLTQMRQQCLQGAARLAPILVGPSRKRFLAHITGRTPSESDVATSAAVVALIGHGADVVRVHNVGLNRDAVLVADAVNRQ
ncbi:Dihydropteroate synthase-like protein [Dunaliella salina]|uniref:Dihydropteroate synthase-like protein n=1 Tax=Dunaliella salina TaxID=3046 RepID=A0ABQ7H6P3_DUNSA|nr:Dihydropteroate synthase-like protein [Dunaliella salina]|eukprot:KAF5842524.1 Dihydropteroate synthase-like protein [Dunaliella salina]